MQYLHVTYVNVLLPVSEEQGNVPYRCCCKHHLMNKTEKEDNGMQRKKKNHPSSLVYCSHQNQTDCKMHLPSAVPVVLTNVAILGQGGRAEPEGWDTLVGAVPLISVVTVETSHESITAPSSKFSSEF